MNFFFEKFNPIFTKKLKIWKNLNIKKLKIGKYEFMDKNDSEIIITIKRLFKSFLVFIEKD